MGRFVTAGVDGSAESLAAAQWAAREALRRGVPLRLVHAWRWHPHPASSVPAGSTERAAAEQVLSEAVGSVRAAHSGLRIDERLVPGAPVTALVSAAETSQLLVLGSRGLGRLAGFVVGDVSQRVVAHSPCPVVLVRAGETSADEHLPALHGISPDEVSETPYRDVVLGLDTEHPCDELIEFAFGTARGYGAPLHVLHAFRPAPPRASDGTPFPGPELLADRERAVVAALRPWCAKFPEVPVVESVSEERATGALVHAARAASLVVVGRKASSSHLGAVTHALLHHAVCPVAVVPHQ
ncbi:universal stress protein [Streptomyces sp. AN091965]|uniref:universal stress protein n=1 Tax=Streptomyces sp. AN091965 TaxID=2927803 RepID=UPI001F61D5F8|nr:universal stress protein [Streptomyces sp. AN091965]MCI3928882.1 universal stress protein [Streptomyces sp. AN091965]